MSRYAQAMSALELKVYEIFKNKLGEKEAGTVIEYLEAKAEEKYQQKKDVLLTKDDKIELVAKIESTKSDIVKWMFAFWIGSIGVISAIMIALFNAYLKH